MGGTYDISTATRFVWFAGLCWWEVDIATADGGKTNLTYVSN